MIEGGHRWPEDIGKLGVEGVNQIWENANAEEAPE